MRNLTAFGVGFSIVAIFGPIYIMLLAPEYFGMIHMLSIYIGVFCLGIFATAMWFDTLYDD
jgi:hypothetical protein